MPKPSYIITTGWWCDDDSSNDRDVKCGSSQIRQVAFFDCWHKAVTTNASPKQIIVVDSASPVKPDYESFENVHWIELPRNPGHSTRDISQYSGYSHGVIIGMLFALLEDVDYCVYIEQDALISGSGIIEYAISTMNGQIMFGSGRGTPQPLQQSFMIFHKKSIHRFIDNFFKIRYRDYIVSPEIKFAIASSPFLSLAPNMICWAWTRSNIFGRMFRKCFFLFERTIFRGWESLPFGFGRTRPIIFTDEYYYFQHGTEKEIHLYQSKLTNSQRK